MFESRGWYCLYLKTEAMMWGTQVTLIPFLNTPNQKEQNAVFRVVPALTPEYSSQVNTLLASLSCRATVRTLHKTPKFLPQPSNQVLISPLNTATEIGRFCTLLYSQYKATFFTWVSQDHIFSTTSNHPNNDTGEGAGLVFERI